MHPIEQDVSMEHREDSLFMQVCRGANDVPDHDISFDLVSFSLMGHGSIKMETSKLRVCTMPNSFQGQFLFYTMR